MKRIAALLLLLSMVLVFVYAEDTDDIVTKYLVNGRQLTDMSIEELYELENSVVAAAVVVFNAEARKTASGELSGCYVVNTKTKKFHYPWCYSGLQIVDSLQFIRETPSALMGMGYKPCGNCNPYLSE